MHFFTLTYKEKNQMTSHSQMIVAEDVKGNMYYTFSSIPDGTKFNLFNLSEMDFTELPEKVAKLKIKTLIIENCPNLNTLEHISKKGLKEIRCKGSNKIEYIPDNIPSEIIKGMPKSEVMKSKVRFVSEYMSVMPRTRLTKPLSGKTKFVSKHVPLTPKFPYVNPCSDNEHTH